MDSAVLYPVPGIAQARCREAVREEQLLPLFICEETGKGR